MEQVLNDFVRSSVQYKKPEVETLEQFIIRVRSNFKACIEHRGYSKRDQDKLMERFLQIDLKNQFK